MDSDEAFLPFSDSEKQPSPVPARKLKRLRKVTEKVSVDLPLSLPSDDAPSVHQVNSSVFEALGRGERNVEDFEELSARSGSQLEGSKEGTALDFESQLEGSEEGNEWDSESQLEGPKEGIELDPGLDGFEVEKVGSGAKRALEFDSLGEEFDGKGVDQTGTEVDEESGDLRTEKGLEMKRRNLDGFEQKREKKKKRVKNANDGYDDNPYSAASTKRTGEKERRDRLTELRTESQRLLRETRDASFKPVPLVQKSVSSVLEKIRHRKQELSKKSVITVRNSFTDDNHSISREVTLDFDIEKFPIVDEVLKAGEADNEEITACPVDVECRIDAQNAQGSKETANESDKNVTSQMALDGDLKQTFRAPIDDAQDLIFYSQASDSKDEMLSSPLDDVLAPSLTAMNLKLDSAPPDDFSSDEEDSNKENTDPLLQASVDLTSSPKGDPVKAFVDDEAEEEDDSDNDLARFQDNEEDEDNMDSEELNDMIATEYEEKPIDNEKRNELHQKWLEQQDAVGTENLLQRLKCSSKQRDMAQIEESDDEESEESEEEFLNDPAEYLVPRNAVRMNLKKAKEMIPQMFTDKDDVYVSSDDEETKKNLVKWRRLSDKAEEQSTFLSPAEYEGSKEIFGLIKKLNCAPDARRKAKITSSFHMLSLGGNRTMSSKSSFLSRGSRKSLPSFQNNGPSTVRSFVFERDDSNSRSAISMSEDSSDTVQKENRPKKTASAKFSNSQVRSSSQYTQPMAEQKSGPSLHEILRCPSMQSSYCSRGSMAGQVEAIYAAFKLDQNLIKKEPAGVSIRTG